jgi:hypothetical protein
MQVEIFVFCRLPPPLFALTLDYCNWNIAKQTLGWRGYKRSTEALMQDLQESDCVFKDLMFESKTNFGIASFISPVWAAWPPPFESGYLSGHPAIHTASEWTRYFVTTEINVYARKVERFMSETVHIYMVLVYVALIFLSPICIGGVLLFRDKGFKRTAKALLVVFLTLWILAIMCSFSTMLYLFCFDHTVCPDWGIQLLKHKITQQVAERNSLLKYINASSAPSM